ncbi:MAG: methionyl-tRNA formyltransferase [Betaproteobacteria bacterium]
MVERVVFFGTPGFAVPTLDALLGSRYRVVAVVTQPDRPRGRGQKTTDAPVKARALAAGVPVFQPTDLRNPEFVARLADLQADLGVVAAYGRILPDAVLKTPRLGMINVHASLLPRYRGAAPVHRAVMAGEHETGVTIMRIVKALDAGPMLAMARRPIGPQETSEDVERGLAQLGAELLLRTVDAMSEGTVVETPQVEADATYAARITREDGAVDWTEPARRIHDRIRGLHPWPHASSHLGGGRLILLRSVASPELSDAAPGTIVAVDADGLTVATGAGTLVVREVQPEGRRPMSVRDFIAGHPVAPGARFTGAA